MKSTSKNTRILKKNAEASVIVRHHVIEHWQKDTPDGPSLSATFPVIRKGSRTPLQEISLPTSFTQDYKISFRRENGKRLPCA